MESASENAHGSTGGIPGGPDGGPDGAPDGGRRVASLFSTVEVHQRALERTNPLGAADMRLLWLLIDGEPQTLREIARGLRREQSTVNRQVNVALGAGLLERTREAGSGRYLFRPSRLGIDEFTRNARASLGVYRTALATLGDEQATFLRLLDRFVTEFCEAVDGFGEAPSSSSMQEAPRHPTA